MSKRGTIGPLAHYEKLLAKGELKADAYQCEVVEKLEAFFKTFVSCRKTTNQSCGCSGRKTMKAARTAFIFMAMSAVVNQC